MPSSNRSPSPSLSSNHKSDKRRSRAKILSALSESKQGGDNTLLKRWNSLPVALKTIDVNANFTPIPYDLCKPSQPPKSQSPDTSEGILASSPLPGEGKPSSLNGATGDRPPSQDVNQGRGETEKQIPRERTNPHPPNGAPGGLPPRRDVNEGNGETEKQLPKDSSNSTDDKVHRVRIEPERTGWARMYDLVREYDKNRITDNKEDIDTLLVFAGLFSAVVTAFIIESYKNLQQQPEDLTNILLIQLINQTSHLAINGNFINSTIPVLNIPSFETSRLSSAINTLWVLSLLIALVTASLGILVKQWFHELLSYETHDPMERLKLRFFREAGVERWKVFGIASALPLLLQLAFLLFFIGLALFFHQLDPVVAWFTTGTGILWLGSLLLTTLAPMFSSQCPYKTPFLKGVISQLRVKLISLSWLRDLANRIYDSTSIEWIWKLSKRLREWSGRVCKTFESLEEGAVCKDGLLSLPVISFTRDLLQGERLWEPIWECFQVISHQDMKKTVEEIEQQSPRMYSILPSIPDGLEKNVASFLVEAAQNTPSQPISFRPEILSLLCPSLIQFQSKAYTPGNWAIPSHSLTAFIHLIRADPTSAAFSFLSMYSTRHRTLEDHPNSFDNLLWLSYSERHSHGIGDQFLSNLLTATKSLIHSIWNQPQDESDDGKIGECVEAIRVNADESDPVHSLDPIAFVSVFAEVLRGLVPRDVVRRRKDKIYEVMDVLAEIVTEVDGSSWSKSRQECTEWAYDDLRDLVLTDGNLGSKLRIIGRTWPTIARVID